MRILVTGGAGYVGTILVKELLKKNHYVTVFDSMIFGCFLGRHDRLRICKSDIRDTDKLKKYCRNNDVLIHLAFLSRGTYSEKHLDQEILSVNWLAFSPLLEIAKDEGIKKFIFASSTSVYGVSDDSKLLIESSPCNPIDMYGRHKLMCEDLLQKHASGSFQVVAVRPSTVHGFSPRMRFELSTNKFILQAIRNNEIRVEGGTQIRPSVNIQDLASIYSLIAEKKFSKPFSLYNVAYEVRSTMETAKIIQEHLQGLLKTSIQIKNTCLNDLRSYNISSELIQKELGFSPSFSVKDSIISILKNIKH